MLRGWSKFVCNECGHKFVGMDLEYQCTALSAPLKCPACGSWHTRPAWSWWQKWVYKEIWKTQDEYRNKTEEQ